MFPFKSMMAPFSAMSKGNQMGFNPFELHSQMMKHPMASGGQSFPFNMMKQHPMMGGPNNPTNMAQQNPIESNSFPFNMMKQNPMMGGASNPTNMMQQNPMGGNSFPFNMLKQNLMGGGINTFPFNYENQSVQEENPFSNSFFQSQAPQQGQNPGQTQQQFPTQFPHSLIRDQNGKLDYKKIGNGVQSTLGLVGQMGPMFKMFSGFFR